MNYNKKEYLNYLKKILSNISIKNNKLTEIKNKKEEITLTKINSNYKDPDIIKFLSFLHNHGHIPDELRIISHNDVMKKLLNLLSIKNNKISDNENLWSILFNIDNQKKVSITRHGCSISNLYSETQDLSNILYNKFKKIEYKDPELTLYGTISSLIHSNKINENEIEFKSSPNKIFVSILIRTWMTAICLYLPNFVNFKKKASNNLDPFTLIITPYVKELDISKYKVQYKIFKDNIPNEFNVQIKNILKFLNYIIRMSDYDFNNTDLNNNLSLIKQYFNEKNELIIVNDNKQKKIHIYMNNNKIINKNKKNNTKIIINNIKICNGVNNPDKNYFLKDCEIFSTIYNNNKCKKIK